VCGSVWWRMHGTGWNIFRRSSSFKGDAPC